MNTSIPYVVLSAAIVLAASTISAQAPGEPAKDERPVFPLLKAYDWNAKELCVFQHYNDIDKSPVPLVAFCHNEQDSYSVITRQAAEKNGWTANSLREQAQRNIDDYAARWEKVRGFMLTASGKDFSSEKLLCKDFLLEAHELLEAEKILVAAPRRTVLYAAPNDLDAENLEIFKTVVSETLADDSFGHQVISPLIFRFEKGELVGALIVREVEE